jgi:hypothetical protein
MNPAPFRPRTIRQLGVAVAIASFATLGCHNLDGFSTKPGYAYCGTIPTDPAFQDGLVPADQPPSLELALTLDISKLTSEPGILTSNDAGKGLCGDLPLFQDELVRAIPEVDHDALSTLSFGEGHEHDFFAWVDSTCQGTMLAVVSLMKNDYVELRLFKPARLPPSDATPAETPGFAVFHLDPDRRPQAGEVKKNGCTF